MLRVLSLGLTVFAFLATVVWLVGYGASDNYRGELTANLEDNKERIWEELTNVQNYPSRKPDVERVEILENDRGLLTWKEYTKYGGFREFKALEQRKPELWIIELYDSSNKVTGAWKYTLVQDEKITKVTAYEVSENKNVWLRGLWTFSGRDIQMTRTFKWLRVALFDRLIREL